MAARSIEIRYDIEAIPGPRVAVSGRGSARDMAAGPAQDRAQERAQERALDRALAFREAAIELIEDALLTAGVGEWESAGIGDGEIRFAFAVDDFEAAEAVVRGAVAGTRFRGIREIARRECDDGLDLAALA